MKKHIALIPARGGSKGLTNKNIRLIAGKPLIVWTIEAAQLAGVFDAIYVSSDSSGILQVAESHGARILERPDALADDTARAIDVLMHAVETIEATEGVFERISYLMPTSPLRTAAHIRDAAALMEQDHVRAVISVKEAQKSILKAFILEKGFLSGIRNNNDSFKNRQELPDVVMPNGAIYMLDVEALKRERNFLIPHATAPFTMSEEESSDLDTEDQIPLLEKKLQALHRLEK